MFGVYDQTGRLIGHYTDACQASRAARSLGDGARVTSADGGYIVRAGTLQRITRCGVLPSAYLADVMAGMYGGCQN